MEMPKKMVENVSEPSAKISNGEITANSGSSMETAPEFRDANVNEKITSLKEKSEKVTSDPIDGDTVERGGAIVETPPNGGNGDGSHEAKQTITGSFTELLLAPLGDIHDLLVETSQNVQEVVATEAEAGSEPGDVSDDESDDTSDEGNTWYIHESDIDDMTSEDVESYDGDDEHVPAEVVVGSGNVASGGAAVDDEHETEQDMVESEAADVGVTADGEHVATQVMVGSGNVNSGGVAADDEHVSEQVMVDSEKVTDVGVAANDEHIVVGSAIVSGGSYASANGVGVVAGEDGQPPNKKMRLENGGNGSASCGGASVGGYGNGLGNGNGGIARANAISTVSATVGNGVQIRMLELRTIRIFGVDMRQYIEVDPQSRQRGFRILSIDGGAGSSSRVVSTSNGGVVGSRFVGSGVGGGSASMAGGSSRGGLPPVPRPNNARLP